MRLISLLNVIVASLSVRSSLEVNAESKPALLEVETNFAVNELSVILDDASEAPIDKHIWLRNLMDVSPDLFQSLVLSNPRKYLPLVYTPTVGQACLNFSRITPAQSGGIYITQEDKGSMVSVLKTWPNPKSVKVIVVTDGSRILGLGDLGADGMGIPLGKAALYVAAGGFAPGEVVPVTLDFGRSSVYDSDYLGFKGARPSEAEIEKLVAEFVNAVKEVYPHSLIQWEDFVLGRAFSLLNLFERKFPSFNDDIQGTASVVLGGLLSAVKLANESTATHSLSSTIHASSSTNEKLLSDQTYLFVGSGSASLGVADLLVEAMVTLEGLSDSDARSRIFMTDSKGLLTLKRQGGVEEGMKRVYTKLDAPELTNLKEMVKYIKPSVLIGLAASGPIFTPEILSLLARLHHRPIVFALSNPTSKAECTAQDAFDASQGRIIFAAGSPFDAPKIRPGLPAPIFSPPPVTSQCNNMFIFPGVGLGASVGKLRHIPREFFLYAAVSLSNQVAPEWLHKGVLFPPIESLREVSRAIAEELIVEGVLAGVSPIASSADDVATHISPLARKMVDEAIWTPSETVMLYGGQSTHAIQKLAEVLSFDRSVRGGNLPVPIPRKGTREYAMAPHAIRFPASPVKESDASPISNYLAFLLFFTGVFYVARTYGQKIFA